MQRLLDAEMREFAFDYLLTEPEWKEFAAFVHKTKNPKFLRTMYGSTSRGALVEQTFVPELERIVAKREKIVVNNADVEQAAATVLENAYEEEGWELALTA